MTILSTTTPTQPIEENKNVIKPRVRYDPPPENANMARALINSFKEHPDRDLLVDSARNWTGNQLLDAVGHIATGLIQQVHLKPNDVVLMMCDRSTDEVLLALGAVLAGGALFGSSSMDGYDETLTLCKIVKPDVIATNSRLLDTAKKLRSNTAAMQTAPIILLDDGPQSVANCQSSLVSHNISRDKLESTTQCCNNNNNNVEMANQINFEQERVFLYKDLLHGSLKMDLVEQVVDKQIVPDQHVLTYMLTSGSTGRPKVVPSTHTELMHGIYSMLSAARYKCESSNNAIDDDSQSKHILPLTKDTILSGDLPLDHGAGVNTMFLSLILGAKFVVLPAYDEEAFWQGVNDHKITTSIASTTFAYRLLRKLKTLIESGHTDKFDLSSFKFLSCAGSKLAFHSLVREINKSYPWISIGQCYGCTEIGFISMLRPVDCKNHLDSIGHLFPGLTGKLVDRNTGQLLGPNQKGELYLYSESKFRGYRCEPGDDAAKHSSACHDEDNFYKTGDLVHYDNDGRLYIHGRIKDTLFLDEDWKIMPAELEQLVDKHPLVEFSAIIGLPDKDLPGCDMPRAFIKLISKGSKEFNALPDNSRRLREYLINGNYEAIEKDIYNFVAERTARPKHLKGGVKILDEFPRVGLLNKVDRKALKLIN